MISKIFKKATLKKNIALLTISSLSAIKMYLDKKKIAKYQSFLQIEEDSNTNILTSLNKFNFLSKNKTYIVSKVLELKEGSLLKIGEGCVLKFADNAGLIIHSGSKLKLNGNSENPIIFTSSDNKSISDKKWLLTLYISSSNEFNYLHFTGGEIQIKYKDNSKKKVISFNNQSTNEDNIELYFNNCLFKNSNMLLDNSSSNGKNFIFNFYKNQISFSFFTLNLNDVSFCNSNKDSLKFYSEIYFSICDLKSSELKSEKIILENSQNILCNLLSNNISINENISQNIKIPVMSNLKLENIQLVNPNLEKNILIIESRQVTTNDISMKSKGIRYYDILEVDHLHVNGGDKIEITGNTNYKLITFKISNKNKFVTFIGNSNIKPKIIINSVKIIGDNKEGKINLRFININIELNTDLTLDIVEFEYSTLISNNNLISNIFMFKTLYKNNFLLLNNNLTVNKLLIHLETKNPSISSNGNHYPLIDLTSWPVHVNGMGLIIINSINVFLGDFYRYKLWDNTLNFTFEICNVYFWGKMFVDGEDRISNISGKTNLFPYGNKNIIKYIKDN